MVLYWQPFHLLAAYHFDIFTRCHSCGFFKYLAEVLWIIFTSNHIRNALDGVNISRRQYFLCLLYPRICQVF